MIFFILLLGSNLYADCYERLGGEARENSAYQYALTNNEDYPDFSVDSELPDRSETIDDFAKALGEIEFTPRSLVPVVVKFKVKPIFTYVWYDKEYTFRPLRKNMRAPRAVAASKLAKFLKVKNVPDMKWERIFMMLDGKPGVIYGAVNDHREKVKVDPAFEYLIGGSVFNHADTFNTLMLPLPLPTAYSTEFLSELKRLTPKVTEKVLGYFMSDVAIDALLFRRNVLLFDSNSEEIRQS